MIPSKSKFGRSVLVLVLLVAGLAAGWFLRPLLTPAAESADAARSAGAAAVAGKPPDAIEHWTCPMHPEIDLPRRGKCPKCGMDLVQKQPADDSGPRTLVMSAAGRKLAEVVVASVERRYVSKRVRLVGKIDYDETRVRTISAWIPTGRIERMYVDYTGVPVAAGDHLVLIYSPELLTAQEELLEAGRTAARSGEQPSEFLRGSDRRALASARDKLRLWGLTAGQIAAIEKRGTAEDRVLINSPSGGIVIHKGLNQGDYFKTGTPIYRIADIDHLWVRLEAYESDLQWVRYGQEVLIETEAWAGEAFRGWVSFIDWEVDDRTRTIGVRVNVENDGRKLKPGMLVRAEIQARIAADGVVMDPRLAGKWVCPMHPEVVEDAAGRCRVCEMPLVEAESLTGVAAAGEPPVVVPSSAVLVTGRRGVVYVEVPGQDQPTYEGREVVLGPRAGDDHIILAGLQPNERVVVNGNFKIDSALQIQAKSSMLGLPRDPGPLQGRALAVLRGMLMPAYDAYFAAHAALAGDDSAPVAAALGRLATAIEGLHLDGKPRVIQEAWHDVAENLQAALMRVDAEADLAAQRTVFAAVSRAMIELERTFGHAGNRAHTRLFCPMAFGGAGAEWLQPAGAVRNPYLGREMLTCGEVRRQYPARSGEMPGGQEPEVGRGAGGAAPEAAGGPPAVTPAPADPAAFRASLGPLYAGYLDVQRALAGDALPAARKGFAALAAAAGATAGGALRGDDRDAWQRLAAAVVEAADRGRTSPDIARARVAFRSLTRAVLETERRFGHVGSRFFEAFCPMAFDHVGASWLQDSEAILNPYFGASMLRCGEIRATFDGKPAATESGGDRGPKPPGDSEPDDKPPAAAAATQLSPVYEAYFAAQEALAGDRLDPARAALGRLAAASAAVRGLGDRWRGIGQELVESARAGQAAADIEAARGAFRRASNAVLAVENEFGHRGSATHVEVFCPMAFGEGASWLQRGDEVSNPFYGASMLRCGEVRQRHAARGAR